MTPLEPDWPETRELILANERQRRRGATRGLRTRFHVGLGIAIAAILSGAGLFALTWNPWALAFSLILFYFGLMLCATSTVPRLRTVGYSGSTAFGVVEYGPPESEVDKVKRKLSTTAAAEWAENADAAHRQEAGAMPISVRIRCLNCDGLNEEAARFCQQCGCRLMKPASASP